MSKNTFPTKIEEMVKNISDVPEPDAVFLNSLREQFIAKGIAAAQKNTETKMKQTTRRGFLTPRLAWGLAIALLIATLAMLASSPTIVNALKRMFGFVPGIGVVEETSLRVLAAPLSAEKDGVALNIVQIAASSEKTIVVYEYPAIEIDYNTFQPPATFKEDNPALLLPDGTRLDVRSRRRISSDIPKTVGYWLEFPPLPDNINNATLELTRLAGMEPGAAPEDWSIPFQVIPAPPGTILPVEPANETESASPSATEAETSSPQTPPTVDPAYGIKSTLESFVRMDDGYLLIGSVQWDANTYPAYAVDPMLDYATVTDAAGKSIEFEVIYGVETPQNEEFRSYWAIKIADTNFQPPLEISITSMVVNFNAGTFQFDPGTNPQPGQSLPLNADVLIAGKNVHFSEAQLNREQSDNTLYFVFTAQTEPNFLGDLYVTMPIHQCMGGGGGYPTDPSAELQIYTYLCRPDLPPGLLDVQIGGADIFGTWVVTWQP
ncbi:MAG: hypothetical protein FJZ86_03475 [Chloroflexi bacterium]|nr:hypothetical protein [Chloroflexota bacterium]